MSPCTVKLRGHGVQKHVSLKYSALKRLLNRDTNKKKRTCQALYPVDHGDCWPTVWNSRGILVSEDNIVWLWYSLLKFLVSVGQESISVRKYHELFERVISILLCSWLTLNLEGIRLRDCRTCEDCPKLLVDGEKCKGDLLLGKTWKDDTKVPPWKVDTTIRRSRWLRKAVRIQKYHTEKKKRCDVVYEVNSLYDNLYLPDRKKECTRPFFSLCVWWSSGHVDRLHER